MKHLKDINMGYFQHLYHAWRMAGILAIHGILPFVWETKVSGEIIDSLEYNKYEVISSLKYKK